MVSDDTARLPLDEVEAEGRKKKREKGKDRKALRVILTVLVCAAVLGAVLWRLTDVLRQKWNYESDNAAQQIVESYYNEKDFSLDVLFLGASTIRNGFSPLELYNEYGFTSCSRATSIQYPVISYYLLLETLETQDIKVVVTDATCLSNMIYESEDSVAGKFHEAIDYMPWSKYKLDLIRESAKVVDTVSPWEYYVPLYTYHDRWTMLNKDDYTYRDWLSSYCYHGQYPTLKTSAAAYDEDYMNENETEADDSFYIMDDSRAYFEKMIDLCRERNIEFILVKAPAAGWNYYRHTVIQEYADREGVRFIDYCLPEIQEEIGFDPRTDYCDGGRHPNITGAQKMSRYLGDYIASAHHLPDRREDPAFISWDRDYEWYKTLLEDVGLVRETNLVSFLQKLNNDNYLVMIATRNDTSKYFNDDIAEALAELGITAPFGEIKCMSYAGVVDGGQVVCQEADEVIDSDNTVTFSVEHSGHKISITSIANQLTGNKAEIMMDGLALSTDSRGFNFAVYDKKTKQLVVQKAFNCGQNGKVYTKDDNFRSALTDPCEYLRLSAGGDYLTVIGVSEDAGRYIPPAVNRTLEELGLLPIDGEFERPYLAVLDGGKIVYNEYGEVHSEIDASLTADGIDIVAVSSTKPGESVFYTRFATEERRVTGPGLTILVYNKMSGKRETIKRFNWADNYATGRNYRDITNLLELLSTVRSEKAELLVAWSPGMSEEGLPEDYAAILQENGFTGFDETRCCAAIMNESGILLSSTGPDRAEISSAGEALRVRTSADENCFTVNGVNYASTGTGLCIMVYDPETKAVLAEKYMK